MIDQHISEAQKAADELLGELDRGPGARELALAKTKLDEAEMWVQRSKLERGDPFFPPEARPQFRQ